MLQDNIIIVVMTVEIFVAWEELITYGCILCSLHHRVQTGSGAHPAS